MRYPNRSRTTRPNRQFQTSLIAVIALGFFLVGICFQKPAQAQDKAAEMDKLMSYCYEQGIFNGTIAVSVDGEVIFRGAFGYADLTAERQLDPDHAFYLASVSKQFTTMAIMILRERGKLSYDDPVAKYFPELPGWANAMNVRHLMTHTSGIPDHYRLGSYRPGLTNQNVLDLVIERVDTLDFAPGSQYSYSNSGYVFLAMLVERVSGTPFHTFMHENIFKPLGMSRTLVYDPSKPKIDKRALGFDQFGQIADYEILTSGAGGMFSTVGDLMKWDRGLSENKLVKKKTLDEAYTPFVLTSGSPTNYGYGWTIREVTTGKIVSHGGSLVGYRTFFLRHLDDKQTIAMLTNKGTVSFNPIVTALTKILNGQAYRMPRIPIAAKMQKLIEEVGVNKAIERYGVLKRDQKRSFVFHENELNGLGYFFLRGGRLKDAIALFELNVQEYSDRSNPYDSLGEAYLEDGQLAKAAENYKKSVELEPRNANGKAMLRKIEKMLEAQSN